MMMAHGELSVDGAPSALTITSHFIQSGQAKPSTEG